MVPFVTGKKKPNICSLALAPQRRTVAKGAGHAQRRCEWPARGAPQRPQEHPVAATAKMKLARRRVERAI